MSSPAEDLHDLKRLIDQPLEDEGALKTAHKHVQRREQTTASLQAQRAQLDEQISKSKEDTAHASDECTRLSAKIEAGMRQIYYRRTGSSNVPPTSDRVPTSTGQMEESLGLARGNAGRSSEAQGGNMTPKTLHSPSMSQSGSIIQTPSNADSSDALNNDGAPSIVGAGTLAQPVWSIPNGDYSTVVERNGNLTAISCEECNTNAFHGRLDKPSVYMNGPIGLLSHVVWAHGRSPTVEELLDTCKHQTISEQDAELIRVGGNPSVTIAKRTAQRNSCAEKEDESYAATVAKALADPVAPSIHPLYTALVRHANGVYLLACDVCGATVQGSKSFQQESRFLIGLDGVFGHRRRAHPEAEHLNKPQLLERCIANVGPPFSAEDVELIIQGRTPHRDIPKIPNKSSATQAPKSDSSEIITGADPAPLPGQTLVYPMQPPTLATDLYAGSQPGINAGNRADTVIPTQTSRSLSAHADAEFDPANVEERNRKRRRTEHPPGWYARTENGGEGWGPGSGHN